MPELNVFELEARNKKLNAEQKRIRLREINDIRKVLKIPEGRRFIWRLWSVCGIFRNPFTANANQSAFNAGRMSVGQEILADVNNADVSAFARLQNEHISSLKSKKEARNGR